MEIVNDKLENNGFSFIWKIHNFSSCVQRSNEYLESPAFIMTCFITVKCNLLLFPRGHFPHDNDVGLRLFMDKFKGLTAVDYEVSMLTTSGLFKKFGSRNISSIVGDRDYSSPIDFLQVSSFHNLEHYLYNDTLTIKCRIFKANNKSFNFEKICCAHTVINIQRTIYNWKIDTLCNSNKITFQTNAESNLFTDKYVTITASLVKEEYSKEGKFEVLIKLGDHIFNKPNKFSFLTCTISIIEDSNILQSEQYHRWFDFRDLDPVCTISITPNINFENHETQGCRRFLRFEFTTSDGSSTVEKIENGTNEEEVLNFVSEQFTHSNNFQCWKDNLQNFFSERNLSDITLKTPEKEFPAHKVMLCAQSKVFRAMFEHDTKENQTGIVDIKDLEAESVSMMLDYVYTGIFKRYDWETAMELYFAADKYEITALKEQCSVFIKSNLGTSNVCKCLIHADLHQDQALKTFIQEFILKHSSEVMKSEEWKQLMKSHGTLAAETMYLLFSKNS